MRRSRYRGIAKSHLQHAATAAAINLNRVVDRRDGGLHSCESPFLVLMAA